MENLIRECEKTCTAGGITLTEAALLQILQHPEKASTNKSIEKVKDKMNDEYFVTSLMIDDVIMTAVEDLL